MSLRPALDPESAIPLYRQLADFIRQSVQAGVLAEGQRLPPTRDWAVLLGVNRATVASAYELLEAEGLVKGHVGRGSFVARGVGAIVELPRPVDDVIHFTTSRPASALFPLGELQAAAQEVLCSPDLGQVLQLGSPAGYPALRQYLLQQARNQGEAGAADDAIVLNGCQQALDLLQRLFAPAGSTVLVEDPVYPGLKNVFTRAGVRLHGLPVGPQGIDIDALRDALQRERAAMIVVTPNFQNPTGATLPLKARQDLVRLAQEHGVLLVENDSYGSLRYGGQPLPTLRQLDESGETVLLRSFSKVAFPGMRVGWVIASKRIAARLAEAKQGCDLHTDQLSQAILLRFAESGRLAQHRERVLQAGRERLAAVLAACAVYLPPGSEFTRPEGGMNLWVRLPQAVDTAELLPMAKMAGVEYLPGRHFAVSAEQGSCLRISFAGLACEEIETGIERLGRVCTAMWEQRADAMVWDSVTAMV